MKPFLFVLFVSNLLLNHGICRVVQIILEHNCDKEQPLLAKIIRVYAPYWFAVARCPPLTFRLVDLPGRKHTRKIALPFQSKKKNEVLFEEITEEEIFGGVTIASALDFNNVGLSVSIAQSGKEQFGPVKDLSPLGDTVLPVSIFYDIIAFSSSVCLLTTFHFVVRMGHWISMLLMVMATAYGFLFPQNLAHISLFLQR